MLNFAGQYVQVRELRGSAAVPQWQSLVSQASRRAVACMWASVGAPAGVCKTWCATRGVGRERHSPEGTAHPWLRVVDGRLLCTWPEAPNQGPGPAYASVTGTALTLAFLPCTPSVPTRTESPALGRSRSAHLVHNWVDG